MPETLYIAPALTDQAGQCRIYSTPGDVEDAGALYRARPEVWREVGLMNSRGQLVCSSVAYQDLKDQEPLMGGSAFLVGDDGRLC